MTRKFEAKTIYPECPDDVTKVRAEKHASDLVFRKTFNGRWILARDWRENSYGTWHWEELVMHHGPLVEVRDPITPIDFFRVNGARFAWGEKEYKEMFPDLWEKYEELIERIKEENK